MNHHFIYQPATRLMALILAVCLMALGGFAVVPASDGYEQAFAQVSYTPQDKIETGDLETFTDDLINRQLAEYQIAGAIVSIVQDGKIELAKGYGYANVEEQIPASANETLFRIGSTSKLITWTAVMQLAEQGKIDLNADVNIYLPDFHIPTTFPQPITMLNLLSHTGGFEERTTGIESHNPKEMISLHDTLARNMPDRVRPVGELSTYSNYGAALAGYIVEAVSGMTFEQYVESYVFKPLSMSHSTFRQPLPADLESHLANSYSYNGEYLPGTFTYVNLRPAGAMSSTAHDMANFMIAHLQDGRFEDNQILKPETARLMHSHLFSNDDRLDGFAYGFFHDQKNGILWHGGDIGYWHSYLVILPGKNLGFFVSYNTEAGTQAAAEFVNSFITTFVPLKGTINSSHAEIPYHDPKDLAGEYRSTRSVYNHVERITNFPGSGYVRVAINPDSILSVAGQTFYEKEFLVYSPLDGTDTIVFHQDGNGKYTHFQINSYPYSAFERISWYESPTFNLLAFGACYALLLTALLAAFMGIFRRRKKSSSDSRLPNIARLWVLIVSIVFLLVPVATIVYSQLDYKYPFPFYMVVVLAIILAASILVIGPVIFTILAWVRRFWGLSGRIHFTLITVALLGMVWFMYYWRLLGFRY